MSENASPSAPLLTTPLHALHTELGARMVPFGGYDMPVQYPKGILAEHRHTRVAAGLFDVSHMGQVLLKGDAADAALESLVPVDIVDLGLFKQRYALFTNEAGGILDDLMVTRREHDLFLVVNAACKHQDIAHLQQHIGSRCTVEPLPEQALLALQGPQAVTALARLNPGVQRLVFMTGGHFALDGIDCFVTRSGYTGEDGFEISLPGNQAERLARPAGSARGPAHRPGRARHAAPGSRPVPVRPRHRHHHDAGGRRADLGHPEGAPCRWRASGRLPGRQRDRQPAGPGRSPQACGPGRH